MRVARGPSKQSVDVVDVFAGALLLLGNSSGLDLRQSFAVVLRISTLTDDCDQLFFFLLYFCHIKILN